MEGTFARQFSFSFEKMVSVRQLYFLVFAFPLWRIVVSSKVM